MRYRGPDPSSKEAIAGLVARRKRREEEDRRFEAMTWGLSPESSRVLTEPDPTELRIEREFERMLGERDSNQETCDRYGDL